MRLRPYKPADAATILSWAAGEADSPISRPFISTPRTRATATIHGQRRRRRPRGGRADDGASGRAPRGGWPPVRGGAGREAFVTGMTRVAGSAGVEPTGKAPSLAGRAAPPRGVKLGGVR